MTTNKVTIWSRIDWITTGFLILTPLLSLILVPYYIANYGFSWFLAFGSLVFLSLGSMSITGGYHRLFAHRAYDAALPVRIAFLLFGAATFQGSVLKWASDHRRHHTGVDTERDPYNINQGFFYAHIGWLFLKDDSRFAGQFATDLKNDKWVAFQHRYYYPIAFLMGFGLPTFVGWLGGSALGGFVFMGLLRIVVGHHTTFFINSLCHTVGKRPYSEKVSARDSFIMALLTFGEGYHNYHHKFEVDYRNGIRWYQWDPTKWGIAVMSWFNLAYRLKRVPQWQILKARLQTDEERLLARGLCPEHVSNVRTKVEEAQKKLRQLGEDYARLKASLKQVSSEKLLLVKQELKRLRWELKVARVQFRAAFAEWSRCVRFPSLHPAGAGSL